MNDLESEALKKTGTGLAWVVTAVTGIISEIDISEMLQNRFVCALLPDIAMSDITLAIEWIAKLSAAFAAIFTARKMMVSTKIEQSNYEMKLAEIAEREKALCDKEKCKDCPNKEG